ncbi:MAG: A/G-specific adenine glycosylase [Lachnospiraceae bacterium]|nr:A/G-specific adenine glycosylase [Lachnospiraceae bacterium]
MKYNKIVEGTFVERPNRFIAKVIVDGKEETVHVKNTGRCRELLPSGAKVYLADEAGKERKTRYDMVAVLKGDRIINMDSQAPNAVIKEALQQGLILRDIKEIKPEFTYGESRFDFFVQTKEEEKGVFIEVKGVTLEQENIVAFPDAPSERAVKHVEELIKAKKEGYRTFIIFVIQMENPQFLIPNETTHMAFAKALRKAEEAGVEIIAFDTKVTEDSMWINHPIQVKLHFQPLYEKITKPLLAWYDKGHRILPWREDPVGYKVWISEIMLQQTRVEAVKPYFKRFMEELPTIESLANCEEEKLLKLWEGLGYYNRARNLQKAARQVMAEYGGELPQEKVQLEKLAGIGSYTSGAISSIAYGKKAVAVDGNVLRILSRLTMNEEDVLKEATKKKIEAQLMDVIPEERPGDFNQALMELGAMVCIPNGKPKCEECPWEAFCQAHKEGREEEFPKKQAKKQRNIEKKTILIVQDEDKTALQKRPSKGLLAGLYEFPSMEGHQTKKAVLEYMKEQGLEVLRIQKMESSKHIFSHKEWHMIAYAIRVDELAKKEDVKERKQWIFAKSEEAAEKYPLPSAFSTYTKCLNIAQGSDKIRGEVNP